MGSMLDLLFPKNCIGCGGEGLWLCPVCYRQCLPLTQAPRCPDCDPNSLVGRFCPRHQEKRQIKGLLAVGLIDNKILREAVHILKYSGVKELAAWLAEFLQYRLNSQQFFTDQVIVPIPLTAQRESERGYNQADLMARCLPGYARGNILLRYRSRPAQVSLNREERQTNLRQVFGIRNIDKRLLAGKLVVVVDDVYTTGTTIDEAAAVVKKAGGATVWGLTVARG